MKLNDFASKIVSKNDFIKASFGGFSGAGKTRTACEFVIGSYKKMKLTKPVLIIDNEKGSRFLIPFFEKAGIETIVKDTTELVDVLMAFDFLNNKEIDYLFIDSLSKIWYKYVRDYRAANRRTFMTLQDWGKILPSWQEEFSDKFVDLNGSCVFTGRGGYTYDMEEDEKTHKKEFVKSGVKMKMAGETPFEPDLNIWMDMCQKVDDDKPIVWREALIMKDRSGLIDGKTFKNPTFKDFEPVLDYLIGVPKGEVKGKTSDKNLAPRENYAAYEKREMVEVELEKIKNLFVKANLGTSNNDKQIKILICEKAFTEPNITWNEMEKFKYNRLKDGRLIIENMLEACKYAPTKESILNYEIPLFN